MNKRNVILGALIALLILGGMGFLGTTQQGEYRSGWVLLQPGEARDFTHNLPHAPDVVYVWVSMTLLGSSDIEDSRPWTEIPETPLFIQEANGDIITIVNQSTIEAYYIRVYAH